MTRIVLIGAPGSGKSTVGIALAAHLQWPFVDTDALIELKDCLLYTSDAADE